MKKDDKSDGAVKAAIIIVLGPAIIALISIGWDKLFPPQSLSHLAGNWKVIEKLKAQEDSSEIDWQYSADIVNKDTLRLSGRKIKVNKKEPSKQEKTARSIYNCKFRGRQSDCKFDELNSTNPVLSGEAKLEFKETFESFSGSAYENGKEVSILSGYRQQSK
jgi:hypothetical protein